MSKYLLAGKLSLLLLLLTAVWATYILAGNTEDPTVSTTDTTDSLSTIETTSSIDTLAPEQPSVYIPRMEAGLPSPTATITPTITPTSTLTITPTPTGATTTPSVTPTATPTGTATQTPTPTVPSDSTPPPVSGQQWNQHAFNAQRTSYSPNAIPTPWRWKWVWNGPTSSGQVSAGKFGLPRNSQPVTGAGRVYIAAGSRGVYALNNVDGSVVWNRTLSGAANSTPAFDPETNALFVVTADGVVHKLNSSNGSTISDFNTGGSSNLPLPPALAGDTVFVSMGSGVYALNTQNLNERWRYEASSPVDTPPAVSSAHDLVVVASRDLFVHGIRLDNGSQVWRTKTTPRVGGDPNGGNNQAQVANGWPVIAEQNGLVLIKLRLDWDTLWTYNAWPQTNSAMRSNLTSDPDQQALLVLRLSDGEQAFIANVGHGGFGNGNYMPMGPMPVIKPDAGGQEVGYVVMRGSPCLANPCDGRWDSRFGELMLNSATIAGYQAGDVRFMQNTFFPTDEQAYLSMAGNDLFGGHWEAGIAHRIIDRGPNRGSGAQPILTADLPHITASQDTDVCNTGFLASHYCGTGLSNTRVWPAGFYIYWNQHNIYDFYWSEYAGWVISNDTLYFVSTDGAIVALTEGNPTAAASMQLAVTHTMAAPAPSLPGLGNSPSDLSQTDLVIHHTQARAYAGSAVTVEGVPVEIFNSGKAVYITFSRPHQGDFIARIPAGAWEHFPAAPETLYVPHRPMQISGVIGWYQGDPIITITRPQQIEVVAE